MIEETGVQKRARRPRPRRRPSGMGRAGFAALLGLALPLAARAEGSLELAPDLGMLVGLIVLFALLVFPVDHFIFRPIFRVLDERRERIAGTRARAEQLEREAEQAFERCESSVRSVRGEAEQERRSLLEDARAEALGATAEARSRVEGEIEAARAEITTSLDAARGVLRSESLELARQAASRVLGRAL